MKDFRGLKVLSRPYGDFEIAVVKQIRCNCLNVILVPDQYQFWLSFRVTIVCSTCTQDVFCFYTFLILKWYVGHSFLDEFMVWLAQHIIETGCH